jgi:hypothetical protein
VTPACPVLLFHFGAVLEQGLLCSFLQRVLVHPSSYLTINLDVTRISTGFGARVYGFTINTKVIRAVHLQAPEIDAKVTRTSEERAMLRRA